MIFFLLFYKHWCHQVTERWKVINQLREVTFVAHVSDPTDMSTMATLNRF